MTMAFLSPRFSILVREYLSGNGFLISFISYTSKTASSWQWPSIFLSSYLHPSYLFSCTHRTVFLRQWASYPNDFLYSGPFTMAYLSPRFPSLVRDHHHMMTSSCGDIFRVTGPLCGELAGHRWIPLTKASDAELSCFLWSAPEEMVE